MLVLSRKQNENLMIGDAIKVTVVEIRGDKVRLGIAAPQNVPVRRQEVFDAINRGSIPLHSPDYAATTEDQITEMARARGLLLNGEALLKIEALAQLFETIIACGQRKQIATVGE